MSQHGSLNQTRRTRSSLFALVPIWDSGEQTLLLSDNHTFRAGRSADCDLVIAHPGVASWHATLDHSDEGVTIQPEGGQHVWINDHLVEAAAQIEIGDTVAIGPATFRVEARRAIRRSAARRANNATRPTPLVSTRLEKHLSDLQQNFGADTQDVNSSAAAESDFSSFVPSFNHPVSDESGLPPFPPGAVHAPGATPFLDFAATTNRRTALDEREGQLNAWHRSLDRRREELDKRSANLTRQQAALTARQTELDHRTAELELWHQSAIEDIEDRKANVNAEAEAELREQRAALKSQEIELRKEQELVSEQLRRMEESRESIAEQLVSLEAARREVKAERAELAEERTRLEAETQAREQADSEQEEAFREQRQKLDEFAAQLESDRDALRQQEESLRSEQQRLESRHDDVAEAEKRLQLEAVERDSSDETSESSDAASEAMRLLEEQKQNLAQQESAIQQQLDALQRREDELELLRNDVESQRALLADEQIALEFERQEASTAFEEARQLQQELRDAQSDIEVDDSGSGFEDQQEELLKREQELNSRTQELANRLADLKAWKRSLESQQQADSNPAATEPPVVERPKSVIANQLSSLLMPGGMIPESEPLQDDKTTEQLQAVQAENQNLQSERSELLDRVADLESQLKAAEQESNSLSSLIAHGDGAVTGKALTEQNLLAELQALKSELTDSQDQAEADSANPGEQAVVQSQVTELEARNQAIEEAHAEEVQKYEATIEQLNGQLEQVQEQFEDLERRAMQAVAAATAGASSENKDESSEAVAEDLQASESEENGDDSDTIATLKQMVEQLSEKLEQRNNTIDNLQAQLNGGVPVDSAASMTPQELKVLSDELDNRTVLLDEREAALRERERLLEQSEQELQSQRVALQEARQQLERARAEIHSAREPAPSESMLLSRDLIDSVTELAEAGATNNTVNVGEPPVEPVEEEAAPQKSSVRSEIAELFGLGGKSKDAATPAEEKKGPSTAAELMEAVDDYSQESAAAVSLSFETAQDILMKPDSMLNNDQEFSTESKEENKDEAEDVVASYMEQLLSRSRAKADGEAPAELKADSPIKKKVDIEKEKAAEKAKSQPGSFIEKYMSGQYSAGETTEEVAEPETTVAPEDQELKDQTAELRRSKIDKDALRNDLQSFRELSTKSAANALASHARRQQKGGIATRTTILTTLGLICVFVLAAAIIGVIPFGWLTALPIAAVIGSATELVIKLKKIQEDVNQKTQLTSATEGEATEATENAVKPAVELNDDVDSVVGEGTDVVQAGTDSPSPITEAEVSVAEDLSVTPTTTDAEVAPAASLTSDDKLEVAEATASPVADVAAEEPSDTTPEPWAAVEENVATEDVASPDAAAENDGVPDAFDEAFRMLTSTSFPIKKSEDAEE